MNTRDNTIHSNYKYSKKRLIPVRNVSQREVLIASDVAAGILLVCDVTNYSNQALSLGSCGLDAGGGRASSKAGGGGERRAGRGARQ